MTGLILPEITFRVDVSPFDADENSTVMRLPAGRTLDLYVAEIKSFDPHAKVSVFLNGDHVEESAWPGITPMGGDEVHVKAIPQGPEEALFLTIAVVGLATGGFGAVALTGATGFGAAAVTSVTVGAALYGAKQLFSPSAPDRGRPNQSDSHDLRSARNRLNPDGAIPLILGTHRMVPPLAAASYTEIEGGDQYLRMLFAVGYGPLDDTEATENLSQRLRDVLPETRPGRRSLAPLSAEMLPDDTDSDDALRQITQALDMRIGNTPLNSFNNVEVEWDMEGTGDPLRLYPNAIQQDALALPLGFRLTDDDGNELTRTVTSTTTIRAGEGPGSGNDREETTSREVRITGTGDWQERTTARNTNEIGITITLPRGLARLNSRSWVAARFQFQFRAVDDTGDWESFSVGSRVRANESQSVFDTTRQDFDGSIFDTAQGSGYNLHINDIRTAKGLDNAGRYTAPGDMDVAEEESTYVQFSRGVVGPVRVSFRVHGLPRGQYDVRLRRVAQGTQFDNEGFNPSIVNEATWTALRSFDSSAPTIRRTGVAQIAIRVRASDQLNGVIDQFNYLPKGLYPVWRGAGDPLNWSESRADLRPSSNPAALYRYILRCDANQFPVPVEDINDDMLGEWFEYCEEHGFEYNGIIDNHRALDDVLRDVAAAGVARRAFLGNQWSVIIDRPQTIPVAHFVPRNTNNLRGRITAIDMPHALRIRFFNEREDFVEDERLVHDDGYSGEDGQPAPSHIVDVDLPGITNPDNIWRLGRRYMAAARLRPEEWIFETGNEARRINVGDLCLLSSDVALIGIQSGRVVSGILDDNGNAGLLLDEPVSVTAAEVYIFRFTRPDGTIVQINYGATETGLVDRVFGLVGDIDSVPDGSIFSFGQFENDAQEVLVSAIESQGDDRFRVTAIPYDPRIYNAEYGIPRYQSNIRRARSITFTGPPPPRVLYAAGGPNELEFASGGVVKPRLFIYLENQTIDNDVEEPIAHYQVRFTTPDFPNTWSTLPLFPGVRTTLEVEGVNIEGLYSIQIRSVGPDGRNFSRWVNVTDIRIINDVIKPFPCTAFTSLNNRLELILEWEHIGGASLAGFQIRYAHALPEAVERIRAELMAEDDYPGETVDTKAARVERVAQIAAWQGMRVAQNVGPETRRIIVGHGPGLYAIKAINSNGLMSESAQLVLSTLQEEPSQASRRILRSGGPLAFLSPALSIRAGVQLRKVPTEGGFGLDFTALRLRRLDETNQGFPNEALFENAFTDDQREAATFLGNQYGFEGLWQLFSNTGRAATGGDGPRTNAIDAGIRVNGRVITELDMELEWDKEDMSRWGDISGVADLTGTPYGDNTGAFIQVRTTTDPEFSRFISNPVRDPDSDMYDPDFDPATTPQSIPNPLFVEKADRNWGPWTNLIRGDFSYTGIEARVLLYTNDTAVTPLIGYPRTWSDRLTTILRGSQTVPEDEGAFRFVRYDQPFIEEPRVQVYTDRPHRIINQSRFGFNIHVGENTSFEWDASGLGFDEAPGQIIAGTTNVGVNQPTPTTVPIVGEGTGVLIGGNVAQRPDFVFFQGGNPRRDFNLPDGTTVQLKDPLGTNFDFLGANGGGFVLQGTSPVGNAPDIPLLFFTTAYDLGLAEGGQSTTLNADTSQDIRPDNPDDRFDDETRDDVRDSTTDISDILNEVVDSYNVPTVPTGNVVGPEAPSIAFSEAPRIDFGGIDRIAQPQIALPTLAGGFSDADFSRGSFVETEEMNDEGEMETVLTVNPGAVDPAFQRAIGQLQAQAGADQLRGQGSEMAAEAVDNDRDDRVSDGLDVSNLELTRDVTVGSALAASAPAIAGVLSLPATLGAGVVGGAVVAWGAYVDNFVARDNERRAAEDREREEADRERQRRTQQRLDDAASEEEQFGSGDARGPHGPHPD